MDPKIVLKDACRGYTHYQDKIISPEETVARFKEKLKMVNLDLLESTVRIDNGRLDIPVYFSVCGEDALNIIGTKKQMGKGGTPQQPEASAVMELAEMFSFFSFWKIDSNFIVEEYRNLDKETVLPFETYDSERTDVYNLLGFCYFKLKEHEEAINYFQKVIKLDPSSAIDYANIASNYSDMSEKERAIHYYRLSLEIDPLLGFARENLIKLEETSVM